MESLKHLGAALKQEVDACLMLDGINSGNGGGGGGNATTMSYKRQNIIHVEILKHPMCMVANHALLIDHVVRYLYAHIQQCCIPITIAEFHLDDYLVDNLTSVKLILDEETQVVELVNLQQCCELYNAKAANVRNPSAGVVSMLGSLNSSSAVAVAKNGIMNDDDDDWQISRRTTFTFRFHVYHQVSDESAPEMLDHDDEQIHVANHSVLPNKTCQALWDSLVFDCNIKSKLLAYAESALIFSDSNVSSDIISWNRVILLHGPPGTGKTTMCRALAHKLGIRMAHRFQFVQFIEVNSHSLFSKWFSESGKLVMKMFSKIQEFVEDKRSLVCVLIDEVESLSAARTLSMSSGEPSDSLRVVNALLTQLDQLKQHSNVLVLTTSNITDAIDKAFVDRADLRIYIGPPSVLAIYRIYRTCIEELIRTGIIVSSETIWSSHCLATMKGDDDAPQPLARASLLLWTLSELSEGLSGRSLRKIPFLSHVGGYFSAAAVPLLQFLEAMRTTVLSMRSEML